MGAGCVVLHTPEALCLEPQPFSSMRILLPLFVDWNLPAVTTLRGSVMRTRFWRTRATTVRVRPSTIACARTHIAPFWLESHVHGTIAPQAVASATALE